MLELTTFAEPKLLFGYNQSIEDPRDGLTLFSPLDEGAIHGIRAGVIGTQEGIRRYKDWVTRIQKPISDLDAAGNLPLYRPFYPGFEAVFNIPWRVTPVSQIVLPEGELEKHLFIDDRYKRVYETVSLYSDRILDKTRRDEAIVDIWFVIVPEEVSKKCRPESTVELSLRIKTNDGMSLRHAQKLQTQPSMFEEENIAARPYHYEVQFHNQLKARLLEKKVLTQVIRETTIAPHEFLNQLDRPIRQVDDPSAIAWNLSTAVFYKAGGRPWRISEVREGVCYLGLAFKQDNLGSDPRSACCAAQMFLDSGDGIVFKGAVGPWYRPGYGDYHLSYIAAKELMGLAIESYKEHIGCPPREVFVHGKVRFHDEEWAGLNAAVDDGTQLVGIRIREESSLRLFTKGKHPVLRGMAFLQDQRTAFLWTRGYTPRLQTYPGWGIPKPLFIEICRGEANIRAVLADILALTKLNYNTCVFADGLPVTLKFAEAVGEILTAGPIANIPPLPFRHYI